MPPVSGDLPYKSSLKAEAHGLLADQWGYALETTTGMRKAAAWNPNTCRDFGSAKHKGRDKENTGGGLCFTEEKF